MKIAVIGASGFVGKRLVPFLTSKGHEVFSIGRDLNIPECEVIINLAGANIFGKRWTEKYKQEILESRLSVCRALEKHKPKLFLCASALAPENTFLSSVVEKWEEAAQKVPAKRTVLMRFSVVLGKEGGALPQMLRGVKWGLGAILGDGAQFMSWIAIDDLLNAINFCIETKALSGPIDFVAPHPIPQKRLMEEIGKKYHRPVFLHMPQKLAHVLLGEAADELLFKSIVSAPDELTKAGFTFELPNIDQALERELT